MSCRLIIIITLSKMIDITALCIKSNYFKTRVNCNNNINNII